MLAFGMFWMLGDKTIVWRWLFPLLPEQVRIGIHPEYTYCIFSLAIAGLAAIGLDALPVRDVARWAIGVVIAAGFVPGWIGAADERSSLKTEPGVTRDAFDGSAAITERGAALRQSKCPALALSTPWTRAWNGPMARRFCESRRRPASVPLALENAIQLRLFLHDGISLGLELSARKTGFARAWTC